MLKSNTKQSKRTTEEYQKVCTLQRCILIEKYIAADLEKLEFPISYRRYIFSEGVTYPKTYFLERSRIVDVVLKNINQKIFSER